jgi:hypothetical protein
MDIYICTFIHLYIYVGYVSGGFWYNYFEAGGMYMHIYGYGYTVYVCIYMDTYMCMFVYGCIHIHMDTYMYMDVFTYICMCIYIGDVSDDYSRR